MERPDSAIRSLEMRGRVCFSPKGLEMRVWRWRGSVGSRQAAMRGVKIYVFHLIVSSPTGIEFH
jgi:hypothetical protein